MEEKERELVLYGSNLGFYWVGSVMDEAQAQILGDIRGANKSTILGEMYCYTRRFQDVKLARIYIDGVNLQRNGNLGDDQLRLRWNEFFTCGLEMLEESVRDSIRFEYSLASSSGWIKLRLPEELNSVHDTFHVSNLKKCLADASLHVPLDEIKVNKTLRFVEEPVEIMDREIRKFKRRKIVLVKVRWNSKHCLEFT
ncbi:hypothetical protein Tco_0266347 [Tanacetum coccineum]